MQQFFSGTEKTGLFFLVVPPGFEEAAKTELIEKTQCLFQEKPQNVKVVTGGVEFEADVNVGVALNSVLKIPSKILLRVFEQRCRDFTKLYKLIKKVGWNQIVGANRLSWSARSRSSRLKIEKRIVETCEQAFADYRKAFTCKNSNQEIEIEISVRVKDDILLVSLDTSGELLHKRGRKILSSKAPIRENLAAGILREVSFDLKEPVQLIDAMAGSGTFSLEAFERNGSENDRLFNYCFFPWVVEPEPEKNITTVWSSALCIESDDEQLEVLQKHLGSYSEVKVLKADFLKKEWDSEVERSAVLVMNPPYGDRLKIQGRNFSFFNEILERVFSLSLLRAGVVLPKEYSAMPARGWKTEKTIDFKNGGIAVRLWIFAKI